MAVNASKSYWHWDSAVHSAYYWESKKEVNCWYSCPSGLQHWDSAWSAWFQFLRKFQFSLATLRLATSFAGGLSSRGSGWANALEHLLYRFFHELGAMFFSRAWHWDSATSIWFSSLFAVISFCLHGSKVQESHWRVSINKYETKNE